MARPLRRLNLRSHRANRNWYVAALGQDASLSRHFPGLIFRLGSGAFWVASDYPVKVPLRTAVEAFWDVASWRIRGFVEFRGKTWIIDRTVALGQTLTDYGSGSPSVTGEPMERSRLLLSGTGYFGPQPGVIEINRSSTTGNMIDEINLHFHGVEISQYGEGAEGGQWWPGFRVEVDVSQRISVENGDDEYYTAAAETSPDGTISMVAACQFMGHDVPLVIAGDVGADLSLEPADRWGVEDW